MTTLPPSQMKKIRSYASSMVLNIHSDASYLFKPQARSCVSGNFPPGNTPVKGQPIVLNGAIYVFCGILKFVAASVAEAELGGPIFELQRRQNNLPNSRRT